VRQKFVIAPRKASPREFPLRRPRIAKVSLPARKMGIGAVGTVQRFRSLESIPKKGLDLRVSLAARFPLRKPQKHRYDVLLRSRAGVVWTDAVPQSAPRPLASLPRILMPRRELPVPGIPICRQSIPDVGLNARAFRALAKRQTLRRLAPREFSLALSSSLILPVNPDIHIKRVSRGAGFTVRVTPSAPAPISPRIATVPFAQEYQSR
jgi:hypothetical protein